MQFSWLDCSGNYLGLCYRNLESSSNFFKNTLKLSTYSQQLVPNVTASFNEESLLQPAEPISGITTSSFTGANAIVLRYMSVHLSWNEKKGSTGHSTPCTAATPILWRIWRPAPYFNLQCILALPLLPLKEKKQELMIIFNSEKRHKSQTPSFANWMPCSLQWLLPKTLGKLAPSRPQYGQPGCGSRALRSWAGAVCSLSLLQQHSRDPDWPSWHSE